MAFTPFQSEQRGTGRGGRTRGRGRSGQGGGKWRKGTEGLIFASAHYTMLIDRSISCIV